MNHISFPSINQYRTVIKAVLHSYNIVRYDTELAELIRDNSIPKPTLTFSGTVKLHGTNAGITFDIKTREFHVQSRERILDMVQDNAGFCFHVNKEIETYRAVVDAILLSGIDYSEYETITLFGEWCGAGVQKGVGISVLPKMFVLFGITLAKEESRLHIAGDTIKGLSLPITTIYDFKTYEIRIDFNNPELSQQVLVDLTNEVEAECPVAKQLGETGVGEGIVWKCTDPKYQSSDFWFKVKGEKHQSSKVKTLAPVDIERANSIIELVDNVLTESRLNQGLEHLTANSLTIEPSNIPVFLRWITQDIVKEELDTIIGSGLEAKEVCNKASAVARTWFLNKYNTGEV